MDLSTQAGQEILSDIERNTSSSRGWRNLMLLCFDQKDIDTFKTLQIICEGLDKLFEMKKLEAKREFEMAVKAIRESKLKVNQRRLPNPIVTVVPLLEGERQTLLKLARTPNNPGLLEKVASYYLDSWGLPDVAQKHLERALNFEPDDKHVMDMLAKAVETLAQSPALTRLPAVEGPTAESTRAELAQTMRLKLPSVLRKASGPLPAEPSQTLIKERIEKLTGKLQGQKKSAGFKTANLGALHQQLRTLQSKIDMIEQRANLKSIPVSAADAVKKPVRSKKPEPPATAAPSPALQTPSDFISQSLADIQEDNLDAAADNCRHALELDPDQPLVWHTWATIGLGYFEKRQLDKAIDSFNEALRLEPNAVESWFNMGVAYSEKGDLEGALRCYLRSLFLAPDNPKVRCNLGAVYFQNSQFTHAEQCFRKALEIHPDYARAWDNLGATLSAMNQLPEAVAACRQAVEIKPDYAEAWFKLGTILYQQEKYGEARDAFRKTIALRHDFPASYVYVAMIESRSGNLEEAEAACKRFTILGGVPGLDWMAWQEFALACLLHNRSSDAVNSARRAADLQPGEAEPWFILGMAQHQAKNYEEAEQAYSLCLKLNNNMPHGWYNLGLIHWECRKFGPAADALERAVLSEPTSASAWFYLGSSREALTQQEPALVAYRKAVELDPKMVDAWQNLGALLERSGHHDEAVECQRKAIEVLQN